MRRDSNDLGGEGREAWCPGRLELSERVGRCPFAISYESLRGDGGRRDLWCLLMAEEENGF